MAKAADVYFQVDPWKIIEEGFDPAYSRVSESVFSLANESLGVRGCFDEGGSADSLRGAYVNGVYDVERLNRSYRGIIDQTHFMIPAADWLMTDLVLDGERLDLGKSLFRDFWREMDMRRGTLKRSFVWRTASGKELRLTFLRFLDMTHRERAYQRVAMEPLNFSGTVDFVSGLSFDVIHEGYKKCYWRDARVEAFENRLMLQSHTTLSGQEVFAGALLNMPPDAAVRKDGQTVSLRAALPLEQGREIHVDKRVVILFDGQTGGALWQSGMAALAESERISLDEALAAQQTYWGDYWRTSDVQIEAAPGNEAVVAAEQQGIRFCSFQLAQTYSGGSMRHNIGAKGLTGEAYNGHAFWDTEACCLPFYLFTNPQAARYLLLFRYNTLPRALERARMLEEIQPGNVVVWDTGRDTISAQWGEMMTKVSKNRGCRGAVIDGGVRDTGRVLEQQFPVFCRYRSSNGMLGRFRITSWQVPIMIGEVRIYPGDVVFGDIDGVIVIPRKLAYGILLYVYNYIPSYAGTGTR